jgi:hypothetical protein
MVHFLASTFFSPICLAYSAGRVVVSIVHQSPCRRPKYFWLLHKCIEVNDDIYHLFISFGVLLCGPLNIDVDIVSPTQLVQLLPSTADI